MKTYWNVNGQVSAIEEDDFASDHVLVGAILLTFPAQAFPILASVIGLIDSMFRFSTREESEHFSMFGFNKIDKNDSLYSEGLIGSCASSFLTFGFNHILLSS